MDLPLFLDIKNSIIGIYDKYGTVKKLADAMYPFAIFGLEIDLGVNYR